MINVVEICRRFEPERSLGALKGITRSIQVFRPMEGISWGEGMVGWKDERAIDTNSPQKLVSREQEYTAGLPRSCSVHNA